MESRSEELRRRHRKILRWSLAVAVVAHVLVLWFTPLYRSDWGRGSGTELVDGAPPPPFGGLAVDVIFGPPAIVDSVGARAQEPAWRFLSASRVLPSPVGCGMHDWFEREYATGRVEMIVGASGRPDSIRLERSSGERCWDAVMSGLASDLLYRWLPSDRFPAPVTVYQPVTVTLTGY